MFNNDVLRSLRYALNVADDKIAEITGLTGHAIDPVTASNLLKKEEEEGYLVCDDATLVAFLDGLIIHKRGKSDRSPVTANANTAPLTHNDILKKLRVAFEFKEEDLHAVLALAGYQASKPEISALFRKPGHKNYRECGDQLLRNFLKGLAIRLRSK